MRRIAKGLIAAAVRNASSSIRAAGVRDELAGWANAIEPQSAIASAIPLNVCEQFM